MDMNEMIATVQVYIKCRKDVDIDISMRNIGDMPKLYSAYSIASKWLMENTNFYR